MFVQGVQAERCAVQDKKTLHVEPLGWRGQQRWRTQSVRPKPVLRILPATAPIGERGGIESQSPSDALR